MIPTGRIGTPGAMDMDSLWNQYLQDFRPRVGDDYDLATLAKRSGAKGAILHIQCLAYSRYFCSIRVTWRAAGITLLLQQRRPTIVLGMCWYVCLTVWRLFYPNVFLQDRTNPGLKQQIRQIGCHPNVSVADMMPVHNKSQNPK
ncbi:hypothetical protein V8C44DRAFT_248867 [Trichoderma aethiopicum]